MTTFRSIQESGGWFKGDMSVQPKLAGNWEYGGIEFSEVEGPRMNCWLPNTFRARLSAQSLYFRQTGVYQVHYF